MRTGRFAIGDLADRAVAEAPPWQAAAVRNLARSVLGSGRSFPCATAQTEVRSVVALELRAGQAAAVHRDFLASA